MLSPTLRVLSSMREHGVRYLLMGGQACIVYGAAEFSRDTDIAVLADPANLLRLTHALDALDAQVIALPPFEPEYLERGHAIHFRCGPKSPAQGMRVDVMASMRNVPSFDTCWERRSTMSVDEGVEVEVMGLEDLVNCKKTRRDKDWPMIRRLVEANYTEPRLSVSSEQLRFWLRELRTPVLLRECVTRARAAGGEMMRLLEQTVTKRSATSVAAHGGADERIQRELDAEEHSEREADEAYWKPRIQELERLRHEARRER
jgi:hypothetical protein